MFSLQYSWAQKLNVQLHSVNKNHIQFICVKITNVANDTIGIYTNGYIDQNGIVVSAGCSTIQMDGYDNQNRVLCSTDSRPLSNPDEVGAKIINLAPGKYSILEIALYSQAGFCGLFETANTLMTSIIAHVDLLYKTRSMSDYERLEISSAALNLNN